MGVNDEIGVEVSSFGNHHIILASENIRDLFTDEFRANAVRTQHTGSAGGTNYILILFDDYDVIGDIIEYSAGLVAGGFLAEFGADIYRRIKRWIQSPREKREPRLFLYRKRFEKLFTQVDYVLSIGGTVYFGIRLPGMQPFPIGLEISASDFRLTNEKILTFASALDNFVENSNEIWEFISNQCPNIEQSRLLGRMQIIEGGSTQLNVEVNIDNFENINICIVSDATTGQLKKFILSR